MKTTLLLAAATAVAAFAFATPALCAEDGRKKTAENEQCIQDAEALRGEKREKALADCQKASGNGHSQQNKMKTCNADAKAKDLHGDERRAFMSTCLKG